MIYWKTMRPARAIPAERRAGSIHVDTGEELTQDHVCKHHEEIHVNAHTSIEGSGCRATTDQQMLAGKRGRCPVYPVGG